MNEEIKQKVNIEYNNWLNNVVFKTTQPISSKEYFVKGVEVGCALAQQSIQDEAIAFGEWVLIEWEECRIFEPTPTVIQLYLKFKTEQDGKSK